MKAMIALALCTQLAGCCGSLKSAIRAYGTTAEDGADVTAEWVNRCKGAAAQARPDPAACDQALKRLAALKAAASELRTVK